MNKRFTVLLVSILSFVKVSICQQPGTQADGAAHKIDHIQVKDELTAEQRASINRMLKENETRLRAEGRIQPSVGTTVTLFAWPVRQAPGLNDPGYYEIGNFVDQNPLPGEIMDYNCGPRTYDGHHGTDIGLWPFSWQKTARNAVQVIAAAPGIIIGKSDNNYDLNCQFCTTCIWNAVYVMHADGSVAWYGHMKAGSLTTKGLGESVAVGEYLGVVGSSGYSTGPHLHFEVQADNSGTLPPNLVDPWAGNCNFFNDSTTWWADQQPYRVPTLNKIMLHGIHPTIAQCASDESVNERINYNDGSSFYVGSYYRDQTTTDPSIHTIYQPNDSVWTTWISNPPTSQGTWYWLWNWVLPNPAPTGNWRYEVEYRSKKTTQWFTVNSGNLVVCPGTIIPIYSNLTGNNYRWQVNTGTGFTEIGDNSFYSGTATNQLQLINVPSSFYGYQYRCRMSTGVFSQIISLKFVSYWNGSKSSSWEDPSNWSCGNVPDANTDVVIQNGAGKYPEVSSNTSCRTVTVNSGATLTIKPGFTLKVTH